MATRRTASSKATRKDPVTPRAARRPRSRTAPAAARRATERATERAKPRSKAAARRVTRAKPTAARKPRAAGQGRSRRAAPAIDMTQATSPGDLRAAQRRHQRAPEPGRTRAMRPEATPGSMGHHSDRFAGARDGGAGT